MMLHPSRVVEHESASSCCACRCVVVRRTRRRGKSCPYVCWVSSHTHGDNFGLLLRWHKITLERDANLHQDPATIQHTPEESCSTLKPPLALRDAANRQ